MPHSLAQRKRGFWKIEVFALSFAGLKASDRNLPITLLACGMAFW